MTLAASMVVRNELGRYLELSVPALVMFCDELTVLDDCSDDGTLEFLASDPWINLHATQKPSFYEHEGLIRQTLLDLTLKTHPTHVLAIDADEFASDPEEIRRVLDESDGYQVWALQMEEVWDADEDWIWLRSDGGWKPHPVPCLWKAPREDSWEPRIIERKLACGRVPIATFAMHCRTIGSSLLHFGWANRAERQARYDRYLVADNGNFHAKAHLDSILWPDEHVEFERRAWPEALEPYKAELLRKIHLEEEK